MAVYTNLSKNNLIDFFSKYNLGKVLNYKEIQEGIENTNYFIKTEKGNFILTVYEKRVDEKELPFFIHCQNKFIFIRLYKIISVFDAFFYSAKI